MTDTNITFLTLAERVEAVTGPNPDLAREIMREMGCSNAWIDFHCEECGEDPTASLDAAMTLAIDGVSAADVLRHAIERCSRYGAPTFIEAFPRFVTSEWLRARASGETE